MKIKQFSKIPKRMGKIMFLACVLLCLFTITQCAAATGGLPHADQALVSGKSTVTIPISDLGTYNFIGFW
jgi:hypothetical protein